MLKQLSIIFLILALASCRKSNFEPSPEYAFHKNAFKLFLDSSSVTFSYLEIREKCDLASECEVVEVSCSLSDPEFSFNLEETTTNFFNYQGLSYFPDVNWERLAEQIDNAEKFEILTIDYGPEPSESYPESAYNINRYLRAGSGGNPWPHYTLRDLVFRVISNDSIVFYLDYKEVR